MKHKRLHHVGIIVPTQEALEGLLKMYDLEIDYHGETPYKTHFYFTKPNPELSESPLEFLVPSGGKLAEFNNGKGGIHHICFEVEDVAASTKEYQEAGYQLLEESFAESANGRHLVNFIKPKSSYGILVELLEEHI